MILKGDKYKRFLFVVIPIAIFSLFYINHSIVIEIKEITKNRIDKFASLFTKALNEDRDDVRQYAIDTLIPSLDFPIIITTSTDECYAILNMDGIDCLNVDQNFYSQTLHDMDQEFKPKEIYYKGILANKIHYSDYNIISIIRWVPFVEISIFFLLMLFTIWSFMKSMHSDRNNIYAGMAKETAHQIGTPLSSLMGWIEYIENHPEEYIFGLKNLKEDVGRLQMVSDRFSKIGVKSILEKVSIKSIILETEQYMSKRLPSGNRIQIKSEIDVNIFIFGDRLLLSWAFENIIKNSVDSLRGFGGLIVINLSETKSSLELEFVDNGVGIPYGLHSKIFSPGVTTKDRGWGIGLSLAKRIIETIHSGKIRLISSMPGKTVFRISFPK
jgi:hypothetical protein